jgi:hypothetical protein
MSTLPGGSLPAYLLTGQYASDYNQVKDLGSSFSLTRTSDQTNQAYFWAAGDGTVKTAGMWNEVAQAAAISAGLSVTDTARLLAAVNVAMADAGIVAMATAYDTQFWRPETAIANGDADGNASTDVDISWAPLISSPSLPEYVALSSHAQRSRRRHARILSRRQCGLQPRQRHQWRRQHGPDTQLRQLQPGGGRGEHERHLWRHPVWHCGHGWTGDWHPAWRITW